MEQIVTNVAVQIIILLYLIDNNEQTSWMILMGSGVGVLIEAWKVILIALTYRHCALLTNVVLDHQGRGYRHQTFVCRIVAAIQA
jgi:hypothetical protein